MFDFSFSRFEFKNMTATPEEQAACNRELELLRDAAPYNSHLLASVERVGSGYWASVEVCSPFRPFSGKAFAGDAVTSATEAIAAVRRRIEEWKRGRGPMAPGTPCETGYLPQFA